MSTTSMIERPASSPAITANRLLYWLSRHWLLVFTVLWGVYVGLPWLAPVFMKLGWTGAAGFIYLLYSTQCHQLPQRSFFLFGEKTMYGLAEIQAAWQATDNPMILRQFVGNPEMGWKVAWSDRMVSMYTSILVGGLLYWPLRRRLRPLNLWGFALLLVPMLIDGTTHMLSDVGGIGRGFRDNNAWLAALTGDALPAAFYAGDGLGSFNSWMRLITGLLFGWAVVWMAYPYVEAMFTTAAIEIRAKFERANRAL